MMKRNQKIWEVLVIPVGRESRILPGTYTKKEAQDIAHQYNGWSNIKNAIVRERKN